MVLAADCAVWICASNAVVVVPARRRAHRVGARRRQFASLRAADRRRVARRLLRRAGRTPTSVRPGGIGVVATGKGCALRALSPVLATASAAFWLRCPNLDAAAGVTDDNAR